MESTQANQIPALIAHTFSLSSMYVYKTRIVFYQLATWANRFQIIRLILNTSHSITKNESIKSL